MDTIRVKIRHDGQLSLQGSRSHTWTTHTVQVPAGMSREAAEYMGAGIAHIHGSDPDGEDTYTVYLNGEEI